MRAIGFRVETGCFKWAVVEGTQGSPILVKHDDAPAPVEFDEPAALVWYRDRVLLLVDMYRPDIAAIRMAEGFAPASRKDSDRHRSRNEGVVIEAVASKKLAITMGMLVTISSNLRVASAKPLLAQKDLRGLDWSKIKDTKFREAILVAVSALP